MKRIINLVKSLHNSFVRQTEKQRSAGSAAVVVTPLTAVSWCKNIVPRT